MACLHARGTRERPAVVAFEIEGAKAVSASDILARLATQSSGRWLWQDARYYDEDAFATDKRRILRYYQTLGYYAARIEESKVVPDGEGRVRLRLRIEEGRPALVTEVEVVGMEGAPEAASKAGTLPLKKGDVFTEAAYDATRAALQAALASTGWAKAEVAEHANVDPALETARVRYTVRTGERYTFGDVFVAGASKIPRARVREEANLAVVPGKTYDATDLPKAQARVFDLGVFGGVRVAPGPPNEARHTLPVVVSVREAPFRTVRAGAGIGIQLNRWDLSAITGWQHRDWLGGLRRLSLDGRVGYAWLPNPFFSQKRGVVGIASADFTQPGLFTRYVDLNLRAELERGLEPAYDFFAQRLRVGTPFKLGKLVTFVPSLNLELYELSNSAGGTDPATGQNLLLQTCPGRNPDLCLLSYFEQRIGLDLRDDPINTHRGFYLGLSLQEGFAFKGNGASYLRLLPEARAFTSFPGQLVLAFRARVGLVQSYGSAGDVPIVARFTSGGPNLMRGYYTRQLSPVIYACTQVAGSTKVGSCNYLPVGGDGLIDGSTELRFPLGGNFGGAVFLDFGNVAVKKADAINLANLQYAVGGGIRYKTIFGPVRIDVAGRLPKATGQSGVEVLTLRPVYDPRDPSKVVGSSLETTGVHHDPIVSVHLSIGEAF